MPRRETPGSVTMEVVTSPITIDFSSDPAGMIFSPASISVTSALAERGLSFTMEIFSGDHVAAVRRQCETTVFAALFRGNRSRQTGHDEPEPQAWHRRMGSSSAGSLRGVNEGGTGEVFFRKMLEPTLGPV